jgi:hypothetical protein
VSPEQQLERFIDRYSPEIASLAREALAKLRERLPGAVQLVYDNFNALVIGFGPSQRASDAVLSVAMYPRWVNLCFLHGASLPDPQGILRGSGNQVRTIRLQSAGDIDSAPVRGLIAEALARSPINPKQPGVIVVRAVAAQRRARRAGG